MRRTEVRSTEGWDGGEEDRGEEDRGVGWGEDRGGEEYRENDST